MTIKKNQEKEPMKSAFSECPHKEECFEKIMDFTLNQLDERILRSLETVKGNPPPTNGKSTIASNRYLSAFRSRNHNTLTKKKPKKSRA